MAGQQHTSLPEDLEVLRVVTSTFQQRVKKDGHQQSMLLQFAVGDPIIILQEDEEENWALGFTKGTCGMFPLDATRPMSKPEKRVYQAAAVASHQPVTSVELRIVKGEELLVICRVGQWLFCRSQTHHLFGLLPVAVVAVEEGHERGAPRERALADHVKSLCIAVGADDSVQAQLSNVLRKLPRQLKEGTRFKDAHLTMLNDALAFFTAIKEEQDYIRTVERMQAIARMRAVRSQFFLLRSQMSDDTIVQRSHVISQFLADEKLYVKNLCMVVERFQRPLVERSREKKRAILKTDQIKAVFGNIQHIHQLAEAMLAAFQACFDEYPLVSSLGNLFFSSAHQFRVYVDYAKGNRVSRHTLKDLKDNSKAWVSWLDEVEDAQLPLLSLLTQPLNRLAHYRLLLQQLLDLGDCDLFLEKSFSIIDQIASHVEAAMSAPSSARELQAQVLGPPGFEFNRDVLLDRQAFFIPYEPTSSNNSPAMSRRMSISAPSRRSSGIFRKVSRSMDTLTTGELLLFADICFVTRFAKEKGKFWVEHTILLSQLHVNQGADPLELVLSWPALPNGLSLKTSQSVVFEKWKKLLNDQISRQQRTRVFGVALGKLAERYYAESVASPRAWTPPVFNKMKALLLDPKALGTPGIFRVSGDAQVIAGLKLRIDKGEDAHIDWSQYSVHDVASLMRQYLGDLPSCLMGADNYDRVLSDWAAGKRGDNLAEVVASLPRENFAVLQSLMHLALSVVAFEESNFMGMTNIAMVLSPIILRPAEETMDYILQASDVRDIVTHMLQTARELFPDLPEVLSMQESYAQSVGGTLRGAQVIPWNPPQRVPQNALIGESQHFVVELSGRGTGEAVLLPSSVLRESYLEQPCHFLLVKDTAVVCLMRKLFNGKVRGYSIDAMDGRQFTAPSDDPKDLVQAMYPKHKVALVQNPGIAHDFLSLDLRQPWAESNFRVAVIYCKGRQTEQQMFENESSVLFESFLAILGERVQLQGWTRYRGNMSVEDKGYSYYTCFKGCEVMFHVACLMSAEQQRRLIGNDTAVIYFYEDEEGSPWDMDGVHACRSNMSQVFAVVRPEGSKVRLGVFRRQRVKQFPPELPEKPLFDVSSVPGQSAFREFVLSKMLNGYRAALNSQPISKLYKQPRVAGIKAISEKYWVKKK